MIKKYQKGFTLVELIIVIAIIAIIMLVGVPAFASIVERFKVRADKASANEIGKAMQVREIDVADEEKVEYYPIVTRYDELSNIEDYVSKDQTPKSMKDGYYFVTAIMVDGNKRILVGIGKEDMPITDIVYNSSKASGWVYIEGGEISNFISENGSMLCEAVVMPDNYDKGTEEVVTKKDVAEKFISLNIGDCIRYNPTQSNYSVTSGGIVSNFYPSQTTLWKVFSINGSSISLISNGSVGNLTLSGKDGYKNSILLLNSVASAYVDNNYATFGRSVGGGSGESSIDESINPITWNETYKKGNNGSPYVDYFHKTDKEIIQSNKPLQYKGDIWLASRYIVPLSSYTYFAVRSLNGNSTECAQSLYLDREDGTNSDLGSPNLGVRVILTLSSDVSVVGGAGTESNPYLLSK